MPREDQPATRPVTGTAGSLPKAQGGGSRAGLITMGQGRAHNEADYAAWTSSIDHIRATPGFGEGNWPREMSLADNLRDLQRHARDFAERRGFTYTVLGTGDGGIIGCVYIYPPSSQAPGGGERRLHAPVESWVRASHAALDVAVHDAVVAWLERDWPFDSIEYAPRT